MNDVILYMLENMVQEKFGENTNDHAWSKTKKARDKRGTMTRGLYNNRDYNSKLRQLSRQFNLPREIILYESGHYIFKKFIKKFPEIVNENKSPGRFLDSVEKLLRTEFRGYFGKDVLPEISVTRREDETIAINYRSNGMSCTIIEGIIKSIADYYGRKITYSQPTCQSRGDGFCTFNLHFYDKRYN
ncbi:MAG: hypothetical protein GXO91_06870 [FCB group bacterium]|nr:hypothetical protein [FCB group bacterium]